MNAPLVIAETAVTPDVTRLAARALKTIARDNSSRQAFQNSHMTQQMLARSATRYVATDQAVLMERLTSLSAKGYAVGTELVGETTRDPIAVEEIVEEYLCLIDAMSAVVWPGSMPSLNFDLSNLGLLSSEERAEANLRRICRAASEAGCEVVLSMEGAELVDAILAIFHRVHPDFPCLGVTVQAFRERSIADLDGVLSTGARVRLVKGVYDEPEGTILASGPALDARYLALGQRIAASGSPLMLATHDQAVLDRFRANQTWPDHVEVEMLHGVRPALATSLRAQGIPLRIYAAYGSNFFLHFLHRLAEYPENVLVALADFADPTRLSREVYR